MTKNIKIKFNKKGFTLIEMLIVIVIIGVLAAALIPRLGSARGRANDTARKADISQVATALVAYQIDYGSFPTINSSQNSGSVTDIAGVLKSAGMNSVPKDPVSSRQIGSGFDRNIAAGEYGYLPIKRNGVDNAGFVLVANPETVGGANWVVDNNKIGEGDYDDSTEIIPCQSIKPGTSNNYVAGGECTWDGKSNALLYIYVQ